MSHQSRTREILGDDMKKINAGKNHNLKGILILALGVAVIFLGFKAAFGTGSPFYVVSSGSMTPTLNINDIILVQGNIPFDRIKIGDVIAFVNPNDHGELIVHRVAQILNQNPLEIRTKGDANAGSIAGIDLPITKDDYIGKVAYVIPQIGYLAKIFFPPLNYVVIASIMGIIVLAPFTRKN
ncbi:MAG: signal peptidase I [Thaumarchaeota archaeon]|nr:MAG: signal peptidase I [Nitrososphaerota archaeon]